LRTPLNAVIGFADILANQYFGDLNARQLDYSRGILQSSQQLLGLIDDISDLATIEAGFEML
jgi:signal transduction histidine kinase